MRDIEVGSLIGESAKFRIYLGVSKSTQPVILKVAKSFEDGSYLAKEASQFNRMAIFENEIAEIENTQDGSSSHYDWLFANLSSSFLEPTQGNRRINVFTVPDIDLAKLIPLAKISAQTEIDARTSIWILGRLFKLYGFFELMAIGEENVTRYPLFRPDDYLIGPENHRLVYYNFSEDYEDVVAFDFVKAIANFIAGWVAVTEDSSEQEYYSLLEDFTQNGRKTAEEAHTELYQLVEKLWGFQYHPFTYRNRGSIVWSTIKEG